MPLLSDTIDTHRASKILGKSMRHMQTMFSLGLFKTARRTGYGTRAHWEVSKSEVICRKFGGELTEQPFNLKLT